MSIQFTADEKLDYLNYTAWCVKMKGFLIEEGSWYFIEMDSFMMWQQFYQNDPVAVQYHRERFLACHQHLVRATHTSAAAVPL